MRDAAARSACCARACANNPISVLPIPPPQAYREDATEEGPGEASTSGRPDPEEAAKWDAFDALVESWLGGSKPRVEVRAAGARAGGAPGRVGLCGLACMASVVGGGLEHATCMQPEADASHAGAWRVLPRTPASQHATRSSCRHLGPPEELQVQSYAEQEEEEDAANVLCARCYSLRHYG